MPVFAGRAEAQREHLLWEAEQFLADAVDEHVVDCVLADQVGIVVAARRSLLELYQDLFDQAEIEDLDFDVVAFALYNLMRWAGALEDAGTVLLLDVSQFEACLVLVRAGAPVAIAMRAWDCGRDEQLADLGNCIEALLEGEELPSRLWIGGTAASEPAWSYDLPNRLGLEGELIDPFRGIDVEALEQVDASVLQTSPEYSVAVGLALRGLGGGAGGLDLDLLQERRGGGGNRLASLAVAAVVAIVLFGALYWTDQRYPLYGVWKDLVAGEEQVVTAMFDAEEEEVATAEVERGMGAEDESVEMADESGEGMEESDVLANAQSAGLGDEMEPGAVEEVVEEFPPLEEPDIAPAELQTPGREMEEGDRTVAEEVEEEQRTIPEGEVSSAVLSSLPQWSAACLHALQLVEQVPAQVRFTSLIGYGTGGYIIEGSTAASKETLEGMKEALNHSSDVDLSWWRTGSGVERSYLFKGQLKEVKSRPLRVLSAAKASHLVDNLVVWARESGLDSLELETISTPLSETLVRQRQKLWARGSYMEMLSFATALEQVGGDMAVSELIAIPHYLRDGRWKKANFYAVVEMLAQAD